MSGDEFEIIRNLFAPLATHPGARGLLDDVAVLQGGAVLVATCDAIVEDVHFLAGDPVDTIAKKALRVNLSDLAAKGAKCSGVLVTLVWPNVRPAAQIADFARGLGEDLRFYDAPLLGGDTCASAGPMVVAITAFGEMLGKRCPSRAEARIGEDVWITGSVGAAWVGLQVDRLGLSEEEFPQSLRRYRTPEPRVAFAPSIAAYASASMDVSDGLLEDAGKLAGASHVNLRLRFEDIPISEETRTWIGRAKEKMLELEALAGGDDYEILFTAAPGDRDAIAAAGAASQTRVTRIGSVEPGSGVALVDGAGNALAPPRRGYVHKLGC